LKQAPFKAVLVWKLNRFSRNRYDSVTYKTLLRKQGIDVISINEPIDDSPIGQLVEGVLESIDEFYSANLGQDIRRGIKESSSRGFYCGSGVPYGYRRIKVQDGAKMRSKLDLEPDSSDAVKAVVSVSIWPPEASAARRLPKRSIATISRHQKVSLSAGQRFTRS